MVTNSVEVKGSNVKKNISTAKVEVLGVKENIIEKEILPKILPKAGKRERRRVAIYAIIAFVLIVPTIIFIREQIEAKKRIKRRKRQKKLNMYKFFVHVFIIYLEKNKKSAKMFA